jgi:hypothetical protein
MKKTLDRKTLKWVLAEIIKNGSSDRIWIIKLLQKASDSGINIPENITYTELDLKMAYAKGKKAGFKEGHDLFCIYEKCSEEHGDLFKEGSK